MYDLCSPAHAQARARASAPHVHACMLRRSRLNESLCLPFISMEKVGINLDGEPAKFYPPHPIRDRR